MSVTEEKNILRKKYKAFRSAMLPDEKRTFDENIFRRIISLPEYQSCSLILTYVSTETETDTLCLIRKSFDDGKTVAVPRSVDKDGNMTFHEIHSFNDLKKGYFGISEPDPEKCREIIAFDGGMCIVPALSYDKQGYRIGYGKGFYDRFFAAHEDILKVGICYSEFMETSLPHDKFDVPADIVITEKFVEDHRKETKPDGKQGNY